MSERTYPRAVWVLMPSFKPKEVEVVRKYGSNYHDYGDLTAAGKLYAPFDMFPTKRAAIEAGWLRVDKQKADLDKRLCAIKKKRDQLQKATAELAS